MGPREKVMRDMPPPEAHMQGGGQRGGPRRWTGTGPRPARHVPWPEIFKHHQSVISGHLKMLDMVRKHTVEDSGNYRTIMPMVDRCKEMLHQFRQVTSTFVPPKNSFDAVPLGSSSASMYPGYSPADHIYGEASQEYGSDFARAKKEGKEPKLAPDGPEYTVGHARVTKRKQLEEVHRQVGSDDGRSGTDEAKSPVKGPEATPAKPMKDEEAPSSTDANPYFVIDTKPTPINTPDRKSDITSHKSKKVKTKHEDHTAAAPVIEAEDISAEVDARIKAKDEKKKRKEKKRKRETDDSATSAEIAEATPATQTEETVVGKPKKKKAKKVEEAAEPVAEDADTEKKKAKRDKKRQAVNGGEEASAVNGDGEADGDKKKRRKKDA